MSVGRLFQAARAATLNAHSPNFDDVHGTSKALLSADRRPGCLVASSRFSAVGYVIKIAPVGI